MAHELEIRNNEAQMFSVNETPWHGLGKVLDKPQTAKEAIQQAGLDWNVRKENMVTESGMLIPDKKAVIRTDHDEYIGTVGNVFTPIQNKDAFNFFDAVVGEGQAIYHTAGSLFNGKRIWILAKLSGSPITVVPNDEIGRYLLLMNAHDGSSKLRMLFTPTRVVCNNTLTRAFSGKTMADGVAIKHTPTMDVRCDEARRLLGISLRYYDIFESHAKTLANKKITSRIYSDYLKNVFPDNENAKSRTRTENIRRDVSHLMDHSTNRLQGMQGSLWQAYNSVTLYTDHYRGTRGRDQKDRTNNRLNSIWTGSSSDVKGRAWSEALKLV